MTADDRRLKMVVRNTFPEEVLTHLLNRDIALWIGRTVIPSANAESIAELCSLSWRLVLSEEADSRFVTDLYARKGQDSPFLKRRGFIDVIARDPEGVELPPRALPVYLLNGREDALDSAESNRLSRNAALRRRLNMEKRLINAQPRVLVVLSEGHQNTVESVKSLWEDGLHSLLYYVCANPDELEALRDWTAQPSGPRALVAVNLDLQEFSHACTTQLAALVPEEHLVVQYRLPDGHITNLDITGCDQIQYPILDRYQVLRVSDLTPSMPHELTEEELNGFFDRSSSSWRPYAAGVPWQRDDRAVKTLMDALSAVEEEGYERNRLLLIQSEPGAGGTTLARTLAFAAAKAGYPTFVAGDVSFSPESTELTTFLFQVRQRFLEKAKREGLLGPVGGAENDGGPFLGAPSCIVFDVHHWQGRGAMLLSFLRDFIRESRPAVVLCVVDRATAEELTIGTVICDPLTHQMSREDVEALGNHLNAFLKHRGKDRSLAEWLSFWQANTPQIGDFGAGMSSFWIALDFWLKRQFDLGQSLQAWLHEQFASAELAPEAALAVVQVAAMSIERRGLPEQLLPQAAEGQYPLSVQLDEVTRDVPALGLLRLPTSSGWQWCIGHTLLARYFMNGVFRDRQMLQSLQLAAVIDPISLRLAALRQIATRPELSTRAFAPIAEDFATTILKLDREGNRELFGHWREVLDILENMPDRVWNTSRAINHHVAISRRRLVTDIPMFGLDLKERLQQINLAIEHLEYALNKLPQRPDDERDINLLNSLARAYQDRASLATEMGDTLEVVKGYRDKASECIRRAESEDPNNPYLLETLARDLIQQGTHDERERLRCGCESLAYIYRALSLESAVYRQERLIALVMEALPLLSAGGSPGRIVLMRQKGEPLGCVGAAWLELSRGQDWSRGIDLGKVPGEQISKAIGILEEVDANKRGWVDLRLSYDLVAAHEPLSFVRQLASLDELFGTAYRPDIQLQAEHAILLYQCGRHKEGNELFRGIRREIAERQAFVVIPDRLRILLNQTTQTTRNPMVCTAVVNEEGGFRGKAFIQELGSQWVPFIPRDWGTRRMPVKTQFQCSIVFGPNGPFAKPPMQR